VGIAGSSTILLASKAVRVPNMYLLAVALVPKADKMAQELLSRTDCLLKTEPAAGVTAGAELLVSEVTQEIQCHLQWARHLQCTQNK